jgi:hypothetical protein
MVLQALIVRAAQLESDLDCLPPGFRATLSPNLVLEILVTTKSIYDYLPPEFHHLIQEPN